ncbi:mitochondrial protein from FMP27-domain-containing protein [Lasiosphaeria ovina]|uniref:COP9 signalosome complex subunit 5 n=1 Tax=Lasiosphaeria ovina TaxID=92902 RepID=A0AAE0TSR1_9PEZI|nr:mitochondrial protein from FMP27-domain-containing protein [Lasiosphaeria ovina]
MALLNPTFIFGILVLLYLSSFIVFAVIRILTGISIQRIGYFSLRRLAYTPRDGLRIEIRGLGLNVHRPTFAQPTWLSIVVHELAVTLDIRELERSKANAAAADEGGSDGGTADRKLESAANAPKTPRTPRTPRTPSGRRDAAAEGRSKTWKQLNRVKERVKRLHRKVNWLRMVDVVATNSTARIVDVGNIQVGSFTMAVDTRRKMVDRARFFLQGRSDQKGRKQQAEWIMTLRSVLFTAHGGESLEILDTASLNIHGFLYEAFDGLRDTAVALKLGRVHVPYDDVRHSAAKYHKIKAQTSESSPELEPLDTIVEQVMQELDEPGSTNNELMQTVSDSKELISSALRGVKEVQFAVSFIGFTKKIEAVKAGGSPILMNASMKEVGIDLHRLDPKSPAHRMYFPSKDIAHEALAAALSISVGLDDGHGKPERIMYIPMATTTVRTTLPSKTVELSDEGTAEERNANILFANSVVTSPSVDLDPRHLPLLLAMLQRKPKLAKAQPPQERHMLISRLLPKANIKFSMHEPVVRIALPPVQKTFDPDEFDLIISSISSVSLDMESFHSAVEDMHYSLAATMRVQTHNLYYQTSAGNRFDLLETESFDLKVELNATPNVHVVATGNLQTLSVKMIREEIGGGLRQIVRQLRLNIEPDKRAFSKTAKQSNFLRAMPAWLLHFQLQCSDFSVEVAGVDKDISEDSRGVAIQLDSWSAEYRAQRLDGLQRRPERRRAGSRSLMPPDIDQLRAVPASPRKKFQHDGDGRRVAFHVRGLEAFIIESAEKWEVEPFVNIPRFEIAFSTLSDNQGPVFHIHSHIRTVLIQYSLYRHYAVGVATSVLRKAFMRTSKDMASPNAPTPATSQRRVVGHLSPLASASAPDFPLNDNDSARAVQELVAVDIKAMLIQIKAEMPSDPPLMLQVYSMEAGRHRWAPPYLQSKLIRLYAEAPRMRRVWARIVSIKNGRVDYRESRRKMSSGATQDERMFDIVSETIRLAVPHEMIMHKVSDNLINVTKSVLQLHHRFKTGTNEYILEKGPEGPKRVPKISLRTRTLLFELEDGAFEWKLGMIYRAGRVEQMQRQAREEAFRVKIKKIHEDESRRESTKLRTRSAAPGGRNASGKSHTRSRSTDGHSRSASNDLGRGRRPRYDPDGGFLGFSGNARVSIAEARDNLDLHNAKSWKQRIDRHYVMARNGMEDLQALFWGVDEIPDDMDDSERILEVPHRPALMSTLIHDLHFAIDKPSFPMHELPDFLYKVGKGMPKDMQYSLLVPMNVQISMGEARISLRDYPLPLLHVPATKPGQSSRLPALSMKTDFVIAEEYRGPDSTRKIKVQIVPPRNPGSMSSKEGSFAIDVRRTIGPVKSFSDMNIEIHTANPTRITWGPSYQPAIQDMMMAIESLTKPQLDPSDKVGFWDKIRLNFHSRVRVAWLGDGDVHLALKGTRDPYSVTGNGAGFLMCWRNDVKWNVHTDDDPKRVMCVESGEYVLAIPDYSHQVRETRRQHGEDASMASDASHKPGASFKKVVMKLSGKVQWLAGLVFERAIEGGSRSFEFKPHYEVVLKSPHRAKPQDGVPYDAFRGFRSQHIHLSVAVRAPVDREWTASNAEPSRSYNTVHVTPRFFTHFFAWWSLFSGPLSLPIRQGSLWPGREKNSKKFGRHLATIKYSLLLAPLFLSHIYKHKDAEDPLENSVSATGIKVRFDSWMLDLHQRREEFNTRDRGRKTQTRTSGMKIHAGQLDLVSADIRAVSASIQGTTAETLAKKSLSTFVTDQGEDGIDLSRFTIPDNDLTWIDMDDFVELDWILPTEPNPDTKILPLAFAPRITYFRQTDIGGIIDGDPDRSSPFGKEPTHICIMSEDDDPRRVQSQLIRRRLEQLDEQVETHNRNLGEIELRLVRGDLSDIELRAEFEALSRHTGVLAEKKTFLEGMLREMLQGSEDQEHRETNEVPAVAPTLKGSMTTPTAAEFASDFKNRFVVHNMQLKWNNTLRNIILRYIHQVSQRRGFIYYLSRPAVKFILDIVEEQAKSKTARNGSGSPGGPGSTPDINKTDREIQKDIEDRIRKILQDGKKFANADDSSAQPSTSMADLSSGLADEFTPQNSYHVRLIAPQIQLQSDKNKKHVVLITAKGMELKVVEVLDKSRISDNVSGLVQRRFLVNMDSTQFFVTHQKWFSTQLVSMYSGNSYGTPSGSSWPPWVPMEVMFDFQTDPFGFKRVVQKTSAMLRYDKYNTLRLKYNDEVNTSGGAAVALHDGNESRMDNLWVEFPQAHALCNSSQYYAIYVIVLDLLMYSEPLEKTRSERLEKIMLASDFSDLRGAPEMLIRLQERVRQLEDIKTHFQIHSKHLDKRGWKDKMVLERDLAACEDELFFMMKAITTSQRKFDNTDSSALLKWSITVKEIVWQLIRDNNEPLVELQLKNVEYDRTDNSDGSHINLIQVGRILGLNLLPDAIYPAMVAPYVEGDTGGFDTGSKPMIRVYWNMLEAIAGIPVMDHFEVNLFPLKIQLEREVGKKLFEYIFPGMEGDKQSEGKNDSPFMIKQTLGGEDEDGADDESLSGSGLLSAIDKDKESVPFSTRPGSLELRLRPTLTSDPDPKPNKQKALSIHSGEGTSFRLFRSGTGFKSVAKKRSVESLRGITPRPGVGRTSTGLSSKDGASSNSESRRGSRFALRHRANPEEEKAKKSDDLTKMIDRASNYMTFAYIKMPSVVLCLSYKGKGDRNLEDVHDFVFRLPTIEYRNKTWSNLDLALALKGRVIKALISHTGAIIGNKFSKHRPSTAQQSKLRELATSSVLLATSQLPDSRDNSGDDSSSLYGTSPVDFSRSPPRSIRRSQTSIPVPSSRSSSIASSRSHRSGQGTVNVNTQPAGALPTFLMAPPTPHDRTPTSLNDWGGHRGAFSLLRPASSGGSRLFGGSVGPRPGSSSGTGPVVSNGGGDETPDRRKSASGGFRDKLSALTHRLREREGSSVSVLAAAPAPAPDASESELPTSIEHSLVDVQRDALYNYDAAAQRVANEKRPWASDPKYFKTVRIGAVALIKMVMHARSGGSLEVMGLMQGYVDGLALVVTDAYRLPVEGTETRVNAQDDANEYMVEYLRLCREESRLENVVGWYHSHPGYGCWLSGIDVGTQAMQQQFNDPFVAVVIDPDRTISASKVEIGAFRTFPENYKPPPRPDSGDGEKRPADADQTVPLAKVEDFGAHSDRYYSLEVEHFKSTLDSKLLELLWNKYWVQTLAQNPLLTNRDYASKQMADLELRVRDSAQTISRGRPGGQSFTSSGSPKDSEQNIAKVVRDVSYVATKERAGLMAGEVKAKLFRTDGEGAAS